MQNKKKILILPIIILCLIGLSLFIVNILKKDNTNLTLTKEEKNWINGNKNQLIDIAILNKIPVINYSGEGIFFDFLTYVEKETGLEFNKIPYISDTETTAQYVLKETNEILENDILIYQDNLVLLSLKGLKYNDVNEISNLNVSVLKDDAPYVKEYLTGTNITYKEYDSVSEMLEFMNEEEDVEIPIDVIVLPKIAYLNHVVNDRFTIAYNINEYKINYVLSLGDKEILNSILKKYYDKWETENYEKSFNNHLIDSYFTFGEKDKASLATKRYTYGFINNEPYDKIIDNDYMGINSSLISSFEDFANIEIIYKKYGNLDNLVEDFNNSSVDIMFDNIGNIEYTVSYIDSAYIYDSNVVTLSHLENDNYFSSIKSLYGQNVLTIKNTKINEYLKSDNYNLIVYDDIKSLIKDLRKDDVIVIDYQNYINNLNSFKQFKIDFTFNLNNKYGFKLNKQNEVFNELFDFYITYYPTKQFVSNGYLELQNVKGVFEISKELLISIVIIITLLIIIVLLKLKPKKVKVKGLNLSKNDKLKYIDMLTSLKNRNYLNDSIEYWDSSEVYPQTIIIVDLNNVAYINDNYGHQEGDNVIREAANVLIRNQVSNTDIIRTNGNEFLIYMVGYDEKQVVTYIKKLNKEFKELSHGFGAAIGYSMINDAIKTIDDAVNEATLDMRTIKEEISG